MDKCWITGIGQDPDWWIGVWDDTRPDDDQPGMAQLFRLNEKWPYPLMPSEYVQRQFHVSFQDDPVAVACRHITGLSTIMWGNDYPHAEGTFRGSQELLASLMAGVPDDERKAMVGGTLGHLLGLRADRGRGQHHGLGGRASLRRPRRGRHRRGSRHRPGPRPAPRPARCPRRGQRPRRLDGGRRAPTRHRRRQVAAEIVEAGGHAIADVSDVSTVEGATALIDAAVEQFGRLDVLINNAGIMRWAGFPELDADQLAQHLAVPRVGSFNTTRAAWPHMVEQGYGRIVMTTSAGLFGLPNNTAYATAKGGVIGLSRSLSVAGARHGIKVNLIAPAAMTRMAGGPSETDQAEADDPAGPMSPDLVAPMVAYLAHEDCPVSGEIYAAGRRSPGPHLHRLDPRLRPSFARAHGGRRGRALGRHQRRGGIRRPGRPHGLVGRLPGPPAPARRLTPDAIRLKLRICGRNPAAKMPVCERGAVVPGGPI